MEVSEITGLSGLEKLRPEWDNLQERCENPSIFSTWEWLYNCAYYLYSRNIHIITVRDSGRLVAILPLLKPVIPVARRIKFLGNGVSDYQDILIDKDYVNSCIRHIVEYMSSPKSVCTFIDFRQIPENSPYLNTPVYNCTEKFNINRVEEEMCPYISLPSTWEEFSATLGKKHRWNIGYYERLVGREFEFEMGLTPPDEIHDEMERFFELHSKRWRRRFLPGVLFNKKVQNFHHSVSKAFQDRGWLRLYRIRLNGQTQASLYCFNYGARGYYYLGGFEPSLSKYSLGTILTAYAIRQSISEGLTEFDFLRGHEPYKFKWTSSYRTNRRILIWKNTFAADISHGTCRIERWFEAKGRIILDKYLGGA